MPEQMVVQSRLNRLLPTSEDDAPAAFAWRLADSYACQTSPLDRRLNGQFFTPLEVARLMASFSTEGSPSRILDPGCGGGILSCAVLELLVDHQGAVHLDAFEVDEQLAMLAERSYKHAQQWLRERGVHLTFEVHNMDFLELNSAALPLFQSPMQFDLAISNPPYFKLRRGQRYAHRSEPNIYAAFMNVMADCLSTGGQIITITPRSFATGTYFTKFRKEFFRKVGLEAIHIFDTRDSAFKHDDVLQENVILIGRRDVFNATVEVSSSHGLYDIAERSRTTFDSSFFVDTSSADVPLAIPTALPDTALLDLRSQWTYNLRKLGLRPSTGPVVAFRAQEHLCEDNPDGDTTVPLLWMHNVRPMKVSWPLESRKPHLIRLTEASRAILVPNKWSVLVRRFSPKEDPHRIVAAPLDPNFADVEVLGLENHLNYVHNPNGEMTKDEAYGLAAILNSDVMDKLFRLTNGHTQVNASELRTLPLPCLDEIRRIGRLAETNGRSEIEEELQKLVEYG